MQANTSLVQQITDIVREYRLVTEAQTLMYHLLLTLNNPRYADVYYKARHAYLRAHRRWERRFVHQLSRGR